MSDRDETRVFVSYCVINFHARDDEEASRMLYEAEDALNKRPGVDAVLDDECYEWLSPTDPDRQWVPLRPVRGEA